MCQGVVIRLQTLKKKKQSYVEVWNHWSIVLCRVPLLVEVWHRDHQLSTNVLLGSAHLPLGQIVVADKIRIMVRNFYLLVFLFLVDVKHPKEVKFPSFLFIITLPSFSK